MIQLRILLALLLLLLFSFFDIIAQDESNTSSQKRLDFARTYFELNSTYRPSFEGGTLGETTPERVKHGASSQYSLDWGGFHFWGHAQIFVSFPLHQIILNERESVDFELTNYTVTGARYLPWKYTSGKVRPYLGVNWDAQTYELTDSKGSPVFAKDFLWVPEIGALYGIQKWSARVGVKYHTNRNWNYPAGPDQFAEIKTPSIQIQAGIQYAFESTQVKDHKVNDRWNTFPKVSGPGYAATTKVNAFIGIGPSNSFTLSKSSYNSQSHPELNNPNSSDPFWDVALGLHFTKAGFFTALSYRNPTFEARAYGTKQEIQKNALAFELNWFVTDYSGFNPFIGLNLSYDRIKFSEVINEEKRTLTYSQIEPGVSFGWDILPGKTEEALILRTNLRWYPFASFEVDNRKFNFDQLEYNLIQAVFYPGRLRS